MRCSGCMKTCSKPVGFVIIITKLASIEDLQGPSIFHSTPYCYSPRTRVVFNPPSFCITIPSTSRYSVYSPLFVLNHYSIIGALISFATLLSLSSTFWTNSSARLHRHPKRLVPEPFSLPKAVILRKYVVINSLDHTTAWKLEAETPTWLFGLRSWVLQKSSSSLLRKSPLHKPLLSTLRIFSPQPMKRRRKNQETLVYGYT